MTGARTRRAERIRAAMPIVDQLTGHTSDVDSSWMTRRWDYRSSGPVWLALPFSKNARGDSPTSESNYRVIEADLDKVSAFGTDYRIDLWPGGSIHTLQVRADDALALRAAAQWIDSIQENGIADESDYSALEGELIDESYRDWVLGWILSNEVDEWFYDLYDDLNPVDVDEAFWQYADQNDYGRDSLYDVTDEGVSWDQRVAAECLVYAIRTVKRRALGREVA